MPQGAGRHTARDAGASRLRRGAAQRTISSATEPRAGLASIREVLERWVRRNSVTRRAEESSVFGRWREVVGNELAECTRVVEISDGELVVEVFSAPLLNELSTYYRHEILESLRQTEELRGLRGLRFRAGSP